MTNNNLEQDLLEQNFDLLLKKLRGAIPVLLEVIYNSAEDYTEEYRKAQFREPERVIERFRILEEDILSQSSGKADIDYNQETGAVTLKTSISLRLKGKELDPELKTALEALVDQYHQDIETIRSKAAQEKSRILSDYRERLRNLNESYEAQLNDIIQRHTSTVGEKVAAKADLLIPDFMDFAEFILGWAAQEENITKARQGKWPDLQDWHQKIAGRAAALVAEGFAPDETPIDPEEGKDADDIDPMGIDEAPENTEPVADIKTALEQEDVESLGQHIVQRYVQIFSEAASNVWRYDSFHTLRASHQEDKDDLVLLSKFSLDLEKYQRLEALEQREMRMWMRRNLSAIYRRVVNQCRQLMHEIEQDDTIPVRDLDENQIIQQLQIEMSDIYRNHLEALER